MKRKTLLDFLIPLLILSCFTMLFWFTNVDIALESFFYSSEKGWVFEKSNPWNFLYHYGSIPALILVITSVFVLSISLLCHKALPYRKTALFLVLLFLINSIDCTIVKADWGRPRPRQIENFGGKERFLPLWVKGVSGEGHSFPSSHACIGYFLVSPFFFLRKIAKKWAAFFLCMGLIYGTLMGIGRMIEGGHFASDVVWSGGFTYLTGLILYYFFRFDKEIWCKARNQKSETALSA